MLTNGLVTVVVDGDDGTFALDGHRGLGRLVDGGDLGDSYNYSPPRDDTLIDTPESVRVEVVEEGPVRAGARITADYRWPEAADITASARHGECRVTVTTKLELHADERALKVTHVASSTRHATTGSVSTCPCPSRRPARPPAVAFGSRRAGPHRGGSGRGARPADVPGAATSCRPAG